MSKQMTISWDFSTQPIGLNGDYVYIEGYGDCDDDSDLQDILVGFTREEYMVGLNSWLDAKREYCERYGHFCGENGNSHSDDYEPKPIDFSSRYEIAYYPNTWSEPDMEHG